MKKPIKFLMGVIVVIAGLVTIASLYALRWVDKQEIPISTDAKNTLRFIAVFYPLIPGGCDEHCVVRTIKIASLVALLDYGKKSPIDLAKDLGIGYSLLSSILAKGDLPDHTAEYEISLERLLFFNRMNALAANFGHRLKAHDTLDKALSLQHYAYDNETKISLRREKFIFRTMQGNKADDAGISLLENLSEPIAVVEAYEQMASGWALCAVQDKRGAEYTKQALQFFKDKRANLIHAVALNIDAPLIAAAEKYTVCESDIRQLKTLLGD